MPKERAERACAKGTKHTQKKEVEGFETGERSSGTKHGSIGQGFPGFQALITLNSYDIGEEFIANKTIQAVKTI